MYCIIKCIVQGKQARVKNAEIASSVLHSCNGKTQICVTRPQCVKKLTNNVKKNDEFRNEVIVSKNN